jgi:hypothetical protein
MRLVLMTLLLMAGVSTSANAQERVGNYTVVGFGDASCEKWTEARADGKSSPMQLWALGYVSGANGFTAEGKDFLKGKDAAAIYGWLDDHCRSQPHELFANAVTGLVNDLKAWAR